MCVCITGQVRKKANSTALMYSLTKPYQDSPPGTNGANRRNTTKIVHAGNPNSNDKPKNRKRGGVV